MQIYWYNILLTFFILSKFWFCKGEELLNTVQGSVAAENYTFYRIQADGHLRLELTTIRGDADLYVSDETRNPQYTNYKLQSCTCGKDSVEIPSSYHRPVGVGVFGSPSSELSKFHLSVYLLPKEKDELTYDQLTLMLNNYEAIDKLMYGSEFGPSKGNNPPRPGSSTSSSDFLEEEDEGSLLWQVFITLLKVIVEILL